MKDDLNNLNRWSYRRAYAEHNYPARHAGASVSIAGRSRPGAGGHLRHSPGGGRRGPTAHAVGQCRSLSLLPGVDSFEVLERPPTEKYTQAQPR